MKLVIVVVTLTLVWIYENQLGLPNGVSSQKANAEKTITLNDVHESGEKQKIHVERVIDGDTFRGNGVSIRVWGIDTPEKKEKGFLAAKMYLEVLLEKGEVSCIYKDRDRYKRYVMQCFNDGQDVGSDLVYMGMAKEYKKYSKGYYALEEAEAKRLGRGIWKRN